MKGDSKKDYYVYAAKLEGSFLYIGSGRANRYLHCINGISHVYELNKLHFSGAKLDMEFLLKGLTKKQSLIEEKRLIQRHVPDFNKTYVDGRNTATNLGNAHISLVGDMRKSFRVRYGYTLHERYYDAINEIVKFIGISKLLAGVVIPSISYGKKYLPTTKAKSLYKKFALTPETPLEDFDGWLSEHFEVTRDGRDIKLKRLFVEV